MQPKSKVLLTPWLRLIKSLTYTNSFRSVVYFILCRGPALVLLLALPSGSAPYQQPCWSNPRCFSSTNAAPPARPTRCLGNHMVNPFKKLILMKTPYKNTCWHKEAARECSGTNGIACPSVPSPSVQSCVDQVWINTKGSLTTTTLHRTYYRTVMRNVTPSHKTLKNRVGHFCSSLAEHLQIINH